METPFFSIVIANYNSGQFLENAILSVLNQRFDQFELIVIDGGSTDNSVEVIKKYESTISFWISEKDTGQSDAFNKGFRKAKGIFYFWLNADDILLPNTLSKAYDFLNKNPQCKWLAGDTIFFDKDGYILWCTVGLKFNKFNQTHGPLTVGGPTSIFHKDLYLEAKGFDESLHYMMDNDLWLSFIEKGHQYKRLGHYCWGFRVHETSKTSFKLLGGKNEKEMEEGIRFRKKHNRKLHASVLFVQRILKIISLTYFKSLIDTRKYKGTLVNEFQSQFR